MDTVRCHFTWFKDTVEVDEKKHIERKYVSNTVVKLANGLHMENSGHLKDLFSIGVGQGGSGCSGISPPACARKPTALA